MTWPVQDCFFLFFTATSNRWGVGRREALLVAVAPRATNPAATALGGGGTPGGAGDGEPSRRGGEASVRFADPLMLWVVLTGADVAVARQTTLTCARFVDVFSRSVTEPTTLYGGGPTAASLLFASTRVAPRSVVDLLEPRVADVADWLSPPLI